MANPTGLLYAKVVGLYQMFTARKNRAYWRSVWDAQHKDPDTLRRSVGSFLLV